MANCDNCYAESWAKPSSLGLSDNTCAMIKVGKNKSGRSIDGIIHNGLPNDNN